MTQDAREKVVLEALLSESRKVGRLHMWSRPLEISELNLLCSEQAFEIIAAPIDSWQEDGYVLTRSQLETELAAIPADQEEP